MGKANERVLASAMQISVSRIPTGQPFAIIRMSRHAIIVVVAFAILGACLWYLPPEAFFFFIALIGFEFVRHVIFRGVVQTLDDTLCKDGDRDGITPESGPNDGSAPDSSS